MANAKACGFRAKKLHQWGQANGSSPLDGDPKPKK
jgi:hypothetical protein